MLLLVATGVVSSVPENLLVLSMSDGSMNGKMDHRDCVRRFHVVCYVSSPFTPAQ